MSVTDKRGHCSICGGTHYGITHVCPYRCGTCGVNTDRCEKPECQRNARWKEEVVAAAKQQSSTLHSIRES